MRPWRGTGKDESLNDLNFDIHLGGRATKALDAEAVRELGQSDLALLATERHIQPSHVQRLSSRHHALARCVATGMSAEEASACTGYTSSRISVMKDDPAFAELVSFYQSDKANLVHDLADKMALRDAAYGRVARHLRDQIEIQREQRRPPTHARRGHRGLAAGMPRAHDHDVVLFDKAHLASLTRLWATM